MTMAWKRKGTQKDFDAVMDSLIKEIACKDAEIKELVGALEEIRNSKHKMATEYPVEEVENILNKALAKHKGTTGI